MPAWMGNVFRGSSSGSKTGILNVQHYVALLVGAEHAAFEGKTEKNDGFYLTTLRVAACGGFAQDAGLANVSNVF